MIDVSKDIHSLTEFKRNTADFLDQLKGNGRAVLLTVNGRAELAVMSAATFQKMLEAVEMLDTVQAVREGINDMNAGRSRPASEFFDEMREKHAPPKNS